MNKSYLLLFLYIFLSFGLFAQNQNNKRISPDQLYNLKNDLDKKESKPLQRNSTSVQSFKQDTSKTNLSVEEYYKESGIDYTENGIEEEYEGTDVTYEVTKDGDTITVYSKEEVFGQSYLINAASDYSSNSSYVPPPNYRIGPGDIITINVWDGSEQQMTYAVENDGSIFIEGLGKIYVQGLTFENLQSMIRARMYSIVSSNSKVDVQLVKVRSIKVNVVGEVNNPNAYIVNSFATVINVLAKAGGVTNLGSMRDIQIKRNGYTIYTFDLYDFIRDGGQINENLYLENNDYIVVPVADKIVKVSGEFRRPKKYQLKEDENLQSLIELAGGVKATARTTQASLYRNINDRVEFINVSLIDYLSDPYMDFVLFDGDVISLPPHNVGVTNVVYISGAVNYPGQYELLSGERLIDIINKAGGLSRNAYLKRAILKRGDSVISTTLYKLNLENFGPDSESNIELDFGDEIQIFSNTQFYSKKFVKILGEVQLPGPYLYSGDMTVKDLILKAGGLKLTADYDYVEISRVYDTSGAMGFTRTKPNEVFRIQIKPNLEEDQNSSNFILKPYDLVTIKKSRNFKLQEVVKIQGEVVSPGPYTIDEEIVTLSDLIKKAGGLTDKAFISDSRFIRKGYGDFYCDFQKAYNNPKSKWDYKLEDGDILIIPRNINIVEIKGAVIQPSSTFADPRFRTVNDYIQFAGGYRPTADKKNYFIKYRNGKTIKPKKILFLKFYPSIEHGAEIVIPEVPIDDSELALAKVDASWRRISQITGFLSSTFSSIVAAYLIISSSK